MPMEFQIIWIQTRITMDCQMRQKEEVMLTKMVSLTSWIATLMVTELPMELKNR